MTTKELLSLREKADAVDKARQLSLPALIDELLMLREENTRVRKILAHVPGLIAIKAKEDAGYGVEIKLASRIEMTP